VLVDDKQMTRLGVRKCAARVACGQLVSGVRHGLSIAAYRADAGTVCRSRPSPGHSGQLLYTSAASERDVHWRAMVYGQPTNAPDCIAHRHGAVQSRPEA
jgi:hypothetical protein